MTLEEAIKRYTSNSFYEKTDGNLQGYLEFNQLAEWLKELKQLREQTQGDLISRQAVLKAIQKLNIPEDMCVFEIISHIEVAIATLPSVENKAGKSCNTCKNNDDEFSGECYECLKGIFDHYEPEEIKTEVKHGRTND